MTLEGIVEIFGNSVGHGSDGSIRGGEGKRFIELKIGVVHTGVEADIIKFDPIGLVLPNNNIVTESHFEARVSCYVGLTNHLSINGGVDDVARTVESGYQILNNVHINVVGDFLDSSFGNISHNSILPKEIEYWLLRFWNLNRLDYLTLNERFNFISTHDLRKSKVHHFFQDFINHNKVLSNSILVQYSAKIFNDLGSSNEHVNEKTWTSVESCGASKV